MVTKKQRQRALARQKWERQQTRRAMHRARLRRRSVVLGAVVGVLAVAAAGYGVSLLFKDDSKANAAPSPTQTASATPEPSTTPASASAPRPAKGGACTYVAQKGDQKSVGLPAATPARKDAVATIKTDKGTVTADLYGRAAGCAVQSFTFLAGKNAYDNTVCSGLSVAPARAAYLECGDLTGSGGSGPGYIFGNENDKATLGPGLLVMADGANRNGSRFYITTGDTSTFDHPVTVFGKVSTGLDIVDKVARAGLAPGSGSEGVGRPATAVIVQDVRVTTK